MKESKYISSDHHKKLIQKEAPKDWTKAPWKEIKKKFLPLARDNYYQEFKLFSESTRERAFES